MTRLKKHLRAVARQHDRELEEHRIKMISWGCAILFSCVFWWIWFVTGPLHAIGFLSGWGGLVWCAK